MAATTEKVGLDWLTPAERAALANELWSGITSDDEVIHDDSIPESWFPEPPSPEVLALIRERMEYARAHPDSFIPAEVVIERMRQKLLEL